MDSKTTTEAQELKKTEEEITDELFDQAETEIREAIETIKNANCPSDSGDVEGLIAKIECAQMVIPPENSYVSTGWRIAKAMSIGLIRAHFAAKTGGK